MNPQITQIQGSGTRRKSPRTTASGKAASGPWRGRRGGPASPSKEPKVERGSSAHGKWYENGQRVTM